MEREIPTAAVESRCVSCGYAAESGGTEWKEVRVPGLGRMTQCPRCDSTNIITGR